MLEALEFTKSQGTGNDFIIVEDLEGNFNLSPKAIAFLCDRHFGIGADGFLLIKPSEIADYKMVYYNSDGSTAEMCGNGIRCLAKYLYDRGLTSNEKVKIETEAGVKEVELLFDESKVIGGKVDMGRPSFKVQDVPILVKGAKEAVEYPLKTERGTFYITALSMGNPHCVLFVEDVDRTPIRSLGRFFEHHPIFPERTNVEFVQVVNPRELKMRVWERGAGETLACGTGACAAASAAIKLRKVKSPVIVKVPGGELVVEWHDSFVYLAGGAEEVFVGFLNQDLLDKLELVTEFEPLGD
jgi:diaminopimelate epimerase